MRITSQRAQDRRQDLRSLILDTDPHRTDRDDARAGIRSLLESDIYLEPDYSDLDNEEQYTPTPTAAQIHRSAANIILAIGPYGCGKSYMSWQHQFALACAMPEIRHGKIEFVVLAIRNTYRMMIDSMLPTMLLAWPRRWAGHWRSSDMEFRGTFTLRRGGRDIDVEFVAKFRSMEKPDSARQLRSFNVTSCLVSEASEIRLEWLLDAWMRTSRFPAGKTPMMALWETNSFSEENPLYTFAIDKTGLIETASNAGLDPDKMLQVFKYPSGESDQAENLENLHPNYYKNLRATRGDIWSDIYIKNEFGSVAPGRLCYREWNPVENVITDYLPNPRDPIWIGFDAGRDSAYVLGQANSNGHLVIFDECWFEDMPFPTACELAMDHFFANWPRDKFNWQNAIADPGTDSKGQADTDNLLVLANNIANKYDLSVVKAWTNKPELRIEAVDMRLRNVVLGKRELQIASKCKHLKNAMTNYYYAEKKVNTAQGEKFFNDRPQKNMASHIAEALQYWVIRDRQTGRRDYVRDETGQFTSVKRKARITMNNPGSAYRLTGYRPPR